MSVWKGNQLIAANGSPGADGHDGRNGIDGRNGTDGRNGEGIMIVPNYTELHNNINTNGRIEITNTSESGEWCEVGGYNSTVNAGQAAIVYGYRCNLDRGTGTAVFGYGNDVSDGGQGSLVEGLNNTVTIGDGCHLEGSDITLSNGPMKDGTHIEGCGHTALRVDADGGHQGGADITANTPMLTMPHQRPGGAYQSTILEAIGLPAVYPNGEFARVVRADGSMAINGDMSFIATKYDGTPETDSNHPDGIYTLGEIVRALHQANIPIPKFTV